MMRIDADAGKQPVRQKVTQLDLHRPVKFEPSGEVLHPEIFRPERRHSAGSSMPRRCYVPGGGTGASSLRGS